jgi:hypothetical protein
MRRIGLLAAALATACGGGRAEVHGDGEHVRKTDDGTIRWTQVDGVAEGPVSILDAEGRRYAEGRYHHGHRDGVWTFYYEDGASRWMEVQYAEGVVDGQMRTWRRDGSPEMELRWAKGGPTPPMRWLEPGAAPLEVAKLPAKRIEAIAARRQAERERAPHCPGDIAAPILQRARAALDQCPGHEDVVALRWRGGLPTHSAVDGPNGRRLAPATVECARQAARSAGAAAGVCADANFVLIHDLGQPDVAQAQSDEEMPPPCYPPGQSDRFVDGLRAEVERCYPEGRLAALPSGRGVEVRVRFDATGRLAGHRVARDDVGLADARACVERVLAEQAFHPPVEGGMVFDLLVPMPRD